jgi:hypothetical protein
MVVKIKLIRKFENIYEHCLKCYKHQQRIKGDYPCLEYQNCKYFNQKGEKNYER